MFNRGLFAQFIKIIVLFLGVYLLVVNIVSLAYYYGSVGNVFDNESLYTALDFNFVGWHDYQPIEYKGFSWFFDKLSTFPGFSNIRKLLEDLQKSAVSLGDQLSGGDIFAVVKYLAKVLTSPFRFIWRLMLDIIQSFGWFFSFLN